MHEMSIVDGLCRQLDELAVEHGATRVHAVTVDVGVLSNIVPELLRHAFDAFRSEVPLIADAELTIREIPLTLECAECGRTTESRELRFRCSACESSRVELRGGEELLLRDVELELQEEHDERDPSHRGEGEPSQVQ